MTNIRKIIIICFLSVLIGTLMGFVSAAFLKLLELVSFTRDKYPFIIAFLPIICIATVFVYNKFGKGSHKGNNLIIESVHKETHVPLRMALFSFVFTILTHLTGGSAGREGTAVQIGGTLANKLGELFKLNKCDKNMIIMAGISAGFGSVFGTPLTGLLFGMEMCFIGKLNYEAIFPCFIASFTADNITRLLGISHTLYSIKNIPSFNFYTIIMVILSACVFGLVGRLFSVSLYSLKNLYMIKIKNNIIRALISSLIILITLLAFHSFRYEGLSTWMISAGFSGKVHLYDPIMKFILTILTLGSGLQGGEVTPLFDIGASLGGLIGQSTHIEPSFLAALGLISVFGCAVNAPITTIILGIEMFGTEAIPYYAISVLISYYISGYSGIYSSQVLAMSKRKPTQIKEGQTLGAIGNKSLIKKFLLKYNKL
ncbi:chloride channel protein [Paludicola sp. MB14-C6]|uniref:chloride channel protein n=1 Tax=Paludihabitans sp. MB14-C6 TaxID=3070656 RepID=UPI0027DBD0F3|nr:chloride channel protein [Paludicola sp. MB14-C6]WMJ23430.1 chloride channel protein [Paludicola sp. MB14-C6]